MTERKRILFIVEIIVDDVYTYIVDHVALKCQFWIEVNGEAVIA